MSWTRFNSMGDSGEVVLISARCTFKLHWMGVSLDNVAEVVGVYYFF
jgi:hypothetical protein